MKGSWLHQEGISEKYHQGYLRRQRRLTWLLIGVGVVVSVTTLVMAVCTAVGP